MSNILETIKKQLHTLAMTDDERADIRLRVASHMHTYKPAHRIPSPYMFGVWHKRLSVMTAVFLIVMVTGGSSLAYASNDALPGDVLYSMKVNGIEELQAAVQPTPQARAEFEVKRVEKRLGEAVTLAAHGQLDAKKQESITANLERHTKKVTEETTKMIQENPNNAVEVSAKLALSLQAHSDAIGIAQEQNKVDGELDSIIKQVDAAQKNAEVEQAAATEVLVANGEASLTVDQLTEKKGRLAKSYAAAFGQEVPAAIQQPAPEAPQPEAGPRLPSEAVQEPFAEAPETVAAPEPVRMDIYQGELPAVETVTAPLAITQQSTDATLTATLPLKDQIDVLFAQADAFIATGNNTEAFLTLQKAEELLLKIELTGEVAKNLEALTPIAPSDAAPIATKPATPASTSETPADTAPAETTAPAATDTATPAENTGSADVTKTPEATSAATEPTR